MLDPEPLIIVGSSARAAAQSAVRAGFSPWCIDQFGDRDLVDVSDNVHTVSDWPNEIESIIQSTPQAEWIYTGALENHPAHVEKLAHQRSLAGCNGESLSKLRDPTWLAETLTKASLPSLPVVVPAAAISNSGEWIVKPLASAAGIGIRDFSSSGLDACELGRHYLQRKTRGHVLSGLYIGVENSARLLGLCEQVCRGTDSGELCYVYSGSFGPLSVDDVSKFRPLSPKTLARQQFQTTNIQRANVSGEKEQDCEVSESDAAAEVFGDVFEQAQKVGSAIEAAIRAEGAYLKGLFGIDFILDDETGKLWTLEVNPRYTASTEIYERAFDWPLIRWHVDACCGRDFEDTTLLDSQPGNGEWSNHGKLIVYAERDFATPDILPLARRLSFNGHTGPSVSVSDIPQIGTLIQKNEPVCTLLTAHTDLTTCREILTSASRELLKLIDQSCHQVSIS